MDSEGAGDRLLPGALFCPSPRAVELQLRGSWGCGGGGSQDARGACSHPCHFVPPWVYGEGSGERTECRTLSRTCKQGAATEDALFLPQLGRVANPRCLLGPGSWPPHLHSRLLAWLLPVTESETPGHD